MSAKWGGGPLSAGLVVAHKAHCPCPPECLSVPSEEAGPPPPAIDLPATRNIAHPNPVPLELSRHCLLHEPLHPIFRDCSPPEGTAGYKSHF